ncbi:hypothetical protein NL676_015732 [Syzygium grande]|nr:hypothetical protein NL676_015732 [Syzygium grande]
MPSSQIGFDFSDVLGPAPVQPPLEVNVDGNPVSGADVDELVYDDPVVISSRSHSLVAPSSCVNQTLRLSMLTLSESDESMDFANCFNRETIKELQESMTDAGGNKKLDTAGDPLKDESVYLEDFEPLKIVGRGAFAKVLQVRKKGTADIHAMEVMRKDKIREKNHAEYMIAERDILNQN